MAKTTDYKPALGLNVVAVRLVKEPKLFPKKLINSSDDAIDCVRNLLATYDREVFCVINLCADSSVINFHVISQGTLISTLVAPREVFKSSILSNAAGVIFLHNHPSGNIKPSADDYAITKRLIECGKLLDIKVVDHIVVGGATGDYYSFSANNELDDLRMEEKNMADNNFDISFRILEHIGTIATVPTGWNKEVNIVSWNGGIPKFDIREWDCTHERMTKGITLRTEEATVLAQVLSDYFARTAESVSPIPVTTPDNV